MTNDAAERLREEIDALPKVGPTPAILKFLHEDLDAALAAEFARGFDAAGANHHRELIEAHKAGRRATVERIRAAFGKNAQLVSEWTAILDAERDR